MSKLQNIFIFFLITNNLCDSTYIRTDELSVNKTELTEQLDVTEEPPVTVSLDIQDILNEVSKTEEEEIEETKEILAENVLTSQSVESPKSQEINSDETSHIFTGELFEIHLTIKHEWSDDFLNKKSMKFQKLAKLIDTELISFFDNQLNHESSIERGSFILKNVLPGATDNFLYVTIVAEASENVTGQIMFEQLDTWVQVYDKFYELGISKDGFQFKSILNEELKKFDEHVECENEFCKPTPEPSLKDFNTILSESESLEEIPEISHNSLYDECNPSENLKRGSTSIYIFENNQKCVENVKKRSLLTSSQKCSVGSQNVQKESSNSEGDDDLDVAASEIHPQTEKVENEKDDEVIVVVRKRGDKVFIEI